MADRSNIQAQSVQKREPATIPEHRTAQAEEVQHAMYLDIRRNWTSEQGNNSYYGPQVFFLKDGCIGIDYGGRVIIRSIELWMSLEQEARQ
jgi:hypothetical protein